MKDIQYTDEFGKNINISVIGFFAVEDLGKEYIMYGIVDDDDKNEYGSVLIGEVIRDESTIQILGILPEEQDLVLAYYNEISNQIGGK